jgi:hypothetical protein
MGFPANLGDAYPGAAISTVTFGPVCAEIFSTSGFAELCE